MQKKVSSCGIKVSTNTIPSPYAITATPSTICPLSIANISAITPYTLIHWWDSATGGTLLGSSSSGANYQVSPTSTTTYYAEADQFDVQITGFINASQIVTWIVPPAVTSIIIEAIGASGGYRYLGSSHPGRGADMIGTFSVNPGDTLSILVGICPGMTPSSYYPGGGGGTFVARGGNFATAVPMIIAGGGGGAFDLSVVNDASLGSSGTGTNPGTNGNGAPSVVCGGGRGGFYTSGGNDIWQNNEGGKGFRQGGSGGLGNGYYQSGGFGGGAVADYSCGLYAGSGGGYSGGSGINSNSYPPVLIGQGGGSYNSGKNQNNSITNSVGNGFVNIEWLIPVNVSCRAPVTINVSNIELPSPSNVIGQPSSVACGGSVSLSATSSNNSISWYYGSAGGNAIGTSLSSGNVIVNPFSTTTYYAESNTMISGSHTYNYTGNVQSFIVPSYVTSLNIDAKGGMGYGVSPNYGGLGGEVRTTLSVSPGQLLEIYIGEEGTGVDSGGWNGGGVSMTAGNGGGATDIRIGGTNLLNRVVVAGGGGGGGFCYWQNSNSAGSIGGQGGGLNGGLGYGCNNITFSGGSQNSGGSGASVLSSIPGANGYYSGLSGIFGCGGTGSSNASGGGGGGGYYGGGGGAFSGGGGGSSWADSSITSGTQHEQGENSGNGQLIISWEIVSCRSATRVSVTISVLPLSPPSPVSANPSTIFCGDSTNLVASTQANFIRWWDNSTGGNLLGSSSDSSDFNVKPTVTTDYWAESYNDGTKIFNYTGGYQNFIVPQGVTALNVDVQGASGGNYSSIVGYYVQGGLGGRVQSKINVIPGQLLYVYVGGAGGALYPYNYLGGWNGGGDGCIGELIYSGRGGGGASDIRTSVLLNNRIIVAGGGGGAGTNIITIGSTNSNPFGGSGGNIIGGNGNDFYYDGYGTGGTQVSGGYEFWNNPGSHYPPSVPSGFGIGASASINYPDAGGGGGYYGGGCGNGGGGGSSYIDSSIVWDTLLTQGYRSGNGQVIISWNGGSCWSSSRTSVTVTVDTLPQSPIVVSNPTAVCTGDTSYLIAYGLGEIKWWSAVTGGTFLGSSVNGTMISVNPYGTTSYYAESIVPCGTSQRVSITVMVYTNTTSILATPSVICLGSHVQLNEVGGNVGTGENWFWYSGSCGGIAIGTGISIAVATPTVITTYWGRYSSSSCGVSSCKSLSINIISNMPLQPDTINGISTPVPGDTLIYSVSNTSGIVYSWSAPTGWTGVSNTSSITFITGSGSGSIIVIPSNACGNGPERTLDVLTGYSISGYFTYDDSSDIAMDSVKVLLIKNGNYIDSIQADINGYYEFDKISNGIYNITATTHKPWWGVNATDAVKVKRHFSGSELLTSSLRLHAADVNLSYSINSTDAVKITRRFVGSDTSFTRGDWVFEKPLGGDTINVSSYLNDTIIVNGNNVTQNFKGLCVGDVNGSNFPIPGAKSSPKIALDIQGKMSINAGSIFELPLMATNDIEVGAISMIMKFPKELVTIDKCQLSIMNYELGIMNDNLVYNVIDDELRVGWFENEGALHLMNGEPVIIISGKTTGNFKPGDVIKFKISTDPLCEFADEIGNPFDNVVLKTFAIEHSVEQNIENSESELNNEMFIFPNPAENTINVRYQIASIGKLTISLFDILGEKIADVIDKSVQQGFYSSEINISAIPSGMYSVRMVINGNTVAVKKLVISK